MDIRFDFLFYCDCGIIWNDVYEFYKNFLILNKILFIEFVLLMFLFYLDR